MRVYVESKMMEHRRNRYAPYVWPAKRELGASHETSFRSRFIGSFLKYSKLYCKYTKLAGFKYFVEPKSTWFDRTLWFLLYVITVPALFFTVYYGYLDFMEDPLFTSVSTEYFPTHKLPFPGVAICSINRISRRSAMELANEIYEANITKLSTDEILEMISQLGDLYDTQFVPQKRFSRIDQLLSVYYDASYSITDVMKRLTPQCSTVLSKCRFNNEERNCSELFQFRKTQDGFCCTFNYATKGDDTPLKDKDGHRTEPFKVQNLTRDGGLSVLLEPHLDDYFYPMFPSSGWKMMIFNPHDYPDMASGGMIDFLVSPRTLRNVEVQALIFYSTRSIIPYPLKKRDCVFTDEMTSLPAFYTYSDCIVDCKIEDMWKSCGCIAFFLPNRESRRVCNLEDVPCLSQHKSKWFSVLPHEDAYTIDDDGKDKEKMLQCHTCYPECSDVRYNAKFSANTLKHNQHVTQLVGDNAIENQGALIVYFNEIGTVELRQDVIFRWYELMGDTSGICGIFVGFSLISVVEFSYFVGLFILRLLKGSEPSEESEKRAKRKQPSIQTIYWGELYTNARTIKNQRDRAHGNY